MLVVLLTGCRLDQVSYMWRLRLATSDTCPGVFERNHGLVPLGEDVPPGAYVAETLLR